MRSSLLPTRRDLTNTAVSAVLGAAAGIIIAVEQRREKTTPAQAKARPLPDDPAWHAAVALGRVRSPE